MIISDLYSLIFDYFLSKTSNFHEKNLKNYKNMDEKKQILVQELKSLYEIAKKKGMCKNIATFAAFVGVSSSAMANSLRGVGTSEQLLAETRYKVLGDQTISIDMSSDTIHGNNNIGRNSVVQNADIEMYKQLLAAKDAQIEELKRDKEFLQSLLAKK